MVSSSMWRHATHGRCPTKPMVQRPWKASFASSALEAHHMDPTDSSEAEAKQTTRQKFAERQVCRAWFNLSDVFSAIVLFKHRPLVPRIFWAFVFCTKDAWKEWTWKVPLASLMPVTEISTFSPQDRLQRRGCPFLLQVVDVSQRRGARCGADRLHRVWAFRTVRAAWSSLAGTEIWAWVNLLSQELDRR